MPCCAPRYGALIVAAIDLLTGITGLILLALRLDVAVVLVCVAFPAVLLTIIGVTLSTAFVKKNTFLTTAALTLKLILVIGCGVIIIILWVHPYFKTYIYTPILIAALFYTIILQLHFSWVVHDFRSRGCRLYQGNIQRRFQYMRVEGEDNKNPECKELGSTGWRLGQMNSNTDDEDSDNVTVTMKSDCII